MTHAAWLPQPAAKRTSAVTLRKAYEATLQASLTLQRLQERMSRHGMARLATKPALRFAFEAVEDEKRDDELGLRAAAILLQQGHGKAIDRSVTLSLDGTDASILHDPESIKALARRVLADPEAPPMLKHEVAP